MGAAWSSSWSTDRKRAGDRVAQHTAASTQGATTGPSREAIALAVEAQTCPFCGAGPYKSLGQHTVRTHGVSAAELRELSGKGRVCSEETSAAARDRLERRPDREEISRRGMEASVAKGSQRVAAAAGGAKQLADNAAKHQEIVRLFKAGVEMRDIAAVAKVSPPTVRRTLKREGLYIDGRTRRWELA